MKAGKVNAWGVLVLLLLAGTILLLGAIALVRKDQHERIGGEIVSDDFGFRVLGVESANEFGPPGAELAASGRFRIVRMEVTNHAKRVDYRLDSHRAVLVDSAGRVYPADPRAEPVWRRTSAGAPFASAISPGESAVTELVYDVPKSAQGLTLRISWGGPLVDILEYVVFGDRRILLE